MNYLLKKLHDDKVVSGKIPRIIRVMFILACLLIIQSPMIQAKPKEQKISMDINGATVEKVLQSIEEKSDYYFLYNSRLINVERKVSVRVKNKPVSKVLDDLFRSGDIEYQMKGTQIILSPKGMKKETTKKMQDVQQQKTITGKIVDAQGEPIIGANVIEKGKTNGTVTDADGRFSLHVEPNAILHISYIGYLEQDINTSGKNAFDIILKEDTKALDEVVVVAYGTQKKRELTGAVSSLNAEEMKDMPVMNLGQKMQGKFSGVQINQIAGTPGAGTSLRIRGQASIQASNKPLVVIDGFPSSLGLESLSSSEIESISVLKDASASSLYGSRAANGVILITTKQAKKGQRRISFTTNIGFSKVPNWGRPNHLMNAQEFAQYKKEIYEDMEKYEGYKDGVPDVYQNPENYGKGTDWFDVLLQNAWSENYTLSLTSGISNLQTATVIDYNKEDGVIVNSYSERFNIRTNNVYKVSDKLRFGANLSAIYKKGQVAGGLGNARGIIACAFLMDPGVKHQNEDGTYPIKLKSPGMFGVPNWYLVVRDRVNLEKNLNVIGNIFGEYEIIDGLKYKIAANVDVHHWVNRQFQPSTVRGWLGGPPPKPAWGRYATKNDLTWLLSNTLNYSKSFNKHSFDVLAGYDVQKSTYENSRIDANKFPDDEIEWINASSSRVGTAGVTEWSMISQIGRLNYNYDGKYLLSLAFRRDGASRFGKNAKWANFPSISAGWVVSDEDFAKKFNKLSWLKLKTSYGVVGNSNIGDYNHLAKIASMDYVFNDAISPGRAANSIGNDDLTWETTKQFDIGFELGLFNDRIYLFYDYYSKKTDGLLYKIDIPTQSGFKDIQANIGQFNFWGHELTLESHILTGVFKWNLNLNATFDRNKTIKLGTNDTPIGGYKKYWDVNRTEVGKPIGLFWGYVFDGVYMTEEEYNTQPKDSESILGSARMKDISGPDGVPDGKITSDDKTFIGDPNPDFYYGITSEFYYKNFDASIIFAGQMGGDIINYTMEWTDNLEGVFNVNKEAANRWRSLENPGNGVYPRTRSGEMFRLANSRWVKDGSYLMAKNITIGYTMPIEIKGLKDIRFYMSIQNAFLLTKYDGMNPEASKNGLNGLSQGIDASFYPVPRTYSLGINLNF